jgi:ribosomal protein S27E
VTNLHALNRTLDQELLAVLRGVSLECLVCGEFLLHAGGVIRCPECGAQIATGEAGGAALQLDLQAG